MREIGGALHIFLKFNPTYTNTQTHEIFNTISEHTKILDEFGAVWWGSFGRNIGSRMISIFQRQISKKNQTKAYLYEKKSNKWYIGIIEDIINEPPSEKKIIPQYYRHTKCKAYIKFSKIIDLKISIKPRDIQNSLIFVYEDGGVGPKFLHVDLNNRSLIE